MKLKPEIKYALLAAAASLAFGLITNALPRHISQKDSLYGYGSDSEVYWDLSENLLSGRGFVHSPGFDFNYIYKTQDYVLGTQRTPGYPLILAGARFLTGAGTPSGPGMAVFNLALVFLNAYFIAGIFKKTLPRISEKYYGLIAFFPPFLIYSNGINVDFISAVLLSGVVYFLLLESKWKYLSLVFAVIALLTRGNVLFFLFPLWVFYIFFNIKSKPRVVLGILGIVVLALAFTGWSLRNRQLSGFFTYAPFTGLQLKQNYIDRIQALVLEEEKRAVRWQEAEFLKQRFSELVEESGGNIYRAEAKMDKEITSDVFALFLREPLFGAKIYLRSIAQMSVNEYFIFNLARTAGNFYVWMGAWALAVLFFALPAMAMLALSFFLAVRRQTSFSAILLYSGALYFLFTAGIWGGFARYLLPAAFVMLISSVFLLHRGSKARILV